MGKKKGKKDDKKGSSNAEKEIEELEAIEDDDQIPKHAVMFKI